MSWLSIKGGYNRRSFFIKNSYNDVFVYGKALIDAVEIEEELAIYPRVVAQKSIQETLPQYF
ncbi:MAG: hypothetical protein L6V95_16040 [Candidatus Melainabacteria bacterium]|nr:MAG: hypothetical protein L6V95_16040 [Candidatus Melainabacteria bacterium]